MIAITSDIDWAPIKGMRCSPNKIISSIRKRLN